MKTVTYLLIATNVLCFISCSENNQRSMEAVGVTTDTQVVVKATIKTTNTVAQKPEKVVMEFLKWYKQNHERVRAIKFIHNAAMSNGSPTYDRALVYSVDFEATEQYLSLLEESGFFSNNYLETQHNYFKERNQGLQDYPQNEYTASSFEDDLVLQTQTYDEAVSDLQHIKKLKLESVIKGDTAFLDLAFPGRADLLEIRLVKINSKWLIDSIESIGC